MNAKKISLSAGIYAALIVSVSLTACGGVGTVDSQFNSDSDENTAPHNEAGGDGAEVPSVEKVSSKQPKHTELLKGLKSIIEEVIPSKNHPCNDKDTKMAEMLKK
ncbi:MAG: hypothetical protein AAFQ01_01510, partial [Bacteroidota bacterium]